MHEGFKPYKDDVVSAFMLLTRLPVPNSLKPGALAPHARSLWAYPLVGLFVGWMGGFTYFIAILLGLGSWIAAILALVLATLATGALHEDGFADTVDAFGGGKDKEAKISILRDSRIGTYGGIALVLSFALRSSALVEITTVYRVFISLIVAGLLSRWVIVLLLRFLPAAKDDGLGAIVGSPSDGRLMAASIIAIGGSFVLLDILGFTCAVAAALTAGIAIGYQAHRQIGGYTGDVLGAGQQIAEIFVLITLAGTFS